MKRYVYMLSRNATLMSEFHESGSNLDLKALEDLFMEGLDGEQDLELKYFAQWSGRASRQAFNNFIKATQFKSAWNIVEPVDDLIKNKAMAEHAEIASMIADLHMIPQDDNDVFEVLFVGSTPAYLVAAQTVREMFPRCFVKVVAFQKTLSEELFKEGALVNELVFLDDVDKDLLIRTNRDPFQ